MNWWATVLHLVRRDRRHLGVAVAASVLLASMPIVRSLNWPLVYARGSQSLLGVVLTSSALLGAWLVSRDAPSSSRAWWAIAPVRGSAVAGGKILVLMVFACVIAAVIGAGGVSWGLPRRSVFTAASLALAGALCAGVAGMLVAVAARTRWMAVLTVVCAITTVSAIAPAVDPWDVLIPAVIWWVAVGATLLTSLSLFAQQYGRLDLSSGRRAVFAGLAFGAVSLPFSAPPMTIVSHPEQMIEGVRLSLDPNTALRCQVDGTIIVGVQSSAHGKQAILADPILTLRLHDGSTRVYRAPDWWQIMGTWGPLVGAPPGRSWKLIGDTGEDDERTSWIAFGGDAPDTREGCLKTAEMTLDTRLTTRAGHVIAVLPFIQNAAARRMGVALHIDSTIVDAQRTAVHLSAASLGPAQADSLMGVPGLQFALIHATRPELIRLVRDGAFVQPHVSADLPGVLFQSAHGTLSLYSPEELPRDLTNDWFSGSSLIVSQMREIGRQRVRLTTAPRLRVSPVAAARERSALR
jgi:hypothetical protein